MSLLTERKQLGLKIEAAEGTPETITTSEVLTVLNVTPSTNLNPVRRPVQKGSFTKSTSGVGIQDGGVTFDIEFAGPADGLVTTASPLGDAFQVCGMRQVDLYAVEVQTFAVAGSFVVVGDEMVGNVSTARIRVLATMSKDTFDDGAGDNNTHYDILFFEVLSGTQTGDATLDCDNTTLGTPANSHGGTTPIIGVSGQAATRVGTAWVPTSSQTKIMTVTTITSFAVGDVISQSIDNATPADALDFAYGRITAIVGNTIEYVPFQGAGGFQFAIGAAGVVIGATGGSSAVSVDPVAAQGPTATAKTFEDGISKTFAGTRGSCTVTLPTGEFPLLNVTLQGAYNAVADEANLTVGGAAQATIPTFLGIEYRIGRTWLPCTSSIAFDLGQNLVRRTCAGNASGLEGFAITDRTITMTMDPEAVQEAVGNAYTDAKAGTAVTVQLRFGNFTSGAGVDAWLVSADQVQYESLAQGDRDGIMTHDATMQVNGYDTLNESELSFLNYSRTAVEAL